MQSAGIMNAREVHAPFVLLERNIIKVGHFFGWVPLAAASETGEVNAMRLSLGTRVQSLVSYLVRMFRETKVLHPSWYILWYRLLVRALVETVWRRIDQRKGLVKSKLGTTATDVEFG